MNFRNNVLVDGIFSADSIQCPNIAITGGNLITPQIIHTQLIGFPTLSTRSAGTKLVLYDSLSASTLDYSIGVEPYNIFFTVPDATSGFKFYGGTGCICTIYGNGNLTTSGNVNCSGTLTVGGFFSHKPYIGVSVLAAGTLSTAVKPGYQTPTLVRTATGVYTFTIPTGEAHPSGTNYTAFVQQRKTAVTDAVAVYSVIVTSSTQFTVWSTNISNVLVDSNFYLHTVP